MRVSNRSHTSRILHRSHTRSHTGSTELNVLHYLILRILVIIFKYLHGPRVTYLTRTSQKFDQKNTSTGFLMYQFENSLDILKTSMKPWLSCGKNKIKLSVAYCLLNLSVTVLLVSDGCEIIVSCF